MPTESSAESQSKPQRSPAYPSSSLTTAIERVKKIWEAQHRHEAHIDSVLNTIGYSNKSGPSLRAIGSLNYFGLITESGAKDERRIRVSELAQDIILLPETDPRRQQALRTAAIKPTIYSILWERYGSHIPDDSVVRAFLVRDKGYNEGIVSDLIANYRSTVELARLGEPLSSQPEETSTDVAVASPNSVDIDRLSSDKTKQLRELPILVGDGKIARIPFPMTEEDFELLLATLNLWKKRIVASIPTSPVP